MNFIKIVLILLNFHEIPGKGLKGDLRDACEKINFEVLEWINKETQIEQFFFNETTFSCEPFLYNGCGANDNRFQNLQDCIETCVVDPLTDQAEHINPSVTFKQPVKAGRVVLIPEGEEKRRKTVPASVPIVNYGGHRDNCPLPQEKNNGELLKDAGNCSAVQNDLLVFTFATEWTDSLQRFLRSGKVNGLSVKALGPTSKKFALIQNALENQLRGNLFGDELVVMVTESSSTLLLQDADEILKKFKNFNARILFATGSKSFNSDGFIGYARDLLKLFNSNEFNRNGQFFFTRLIFDENLRNKYKIGVDKNSKIFQAVDETTRNHLEVRFQNGLPVLVNTQNNQYPSVILGNNEMTSKIIINSLGNYLPDGWSQGRCLACLENTISLGKIEMPIIYLGIFISRPIPFLEEFFTKIRNLSYPKKRIHVFIYNGERCHHNLTSGFVKNFTSEYASVEVFPQEDNSLEALARTYAVESALLLECDYFLSVNGEAHLDNPSTLKVLIKQNRGIIAPLLKRPFKKYSNFWGMVNKGFYARSSDYDLIVEGKQRGVWNVPYITGAYLVSKRILQKERNRPNYLTGLDPDLAFCENNRIKGNFMFLSNLEEFGHLVNSDFNFNTSRLHNELFQVSSNRLDWEARYIHPEWSKAVHSELKLPEMMANKDIMPCPDVFWFPLVSSRFCDELIAEMENYGNWSGGGYKNPNNKKHLTVEIRLTQVCMHAQWLEVLRNYVLPLQKKVYPGHSNEHQPNGHYFFVVRYKPDEQNELKPHEDASSYTINVALNHPHKDYEGGGCRFTRYDCSVRETKQGWMLMHPGRQTHMHQGLPVTKGTRYILVNFLNPN